jgi:hypothetical protein
LTDGTYSACRCRNDGNTTCDLADGDREWYDLRDAACAKDVSAFWEARLSIEYEAYAERLPQAASHIFDDLNWYFWLQDGGNMTEFMWQQSLARLGLLSQTAVVALLLVIAVI